MRKSYPLIIGLVLLSVCAQAKVFNISSPDGRLRAEVNVGQSVTYSLAFSGQELLSQTPLSMTLADGTTWGVGSKLTSSKASKHSGVIKAAFYKKAEVRDDYNQLLLRFRGFNIVFRAYNEGLAYRFEATGKATSNIQNEQMQLRFVKDFPVWMGYVRDQGDLEDMFHNSFENDYTLINVSQFDSKRLAFLPFIVKADAGVRLVVAESDVENYPCMFIEKGSEPQSLESKFAPYPKEIRQGGHNMLEQLVKKREDYIAHCDGPRTFPWRILAVAATDADILGNDMVYRLASPSRLDDVSWIRPGKVAWEWWNDWGIYGVPFRAGINTDTYKYYIDFASRKGIEYIILDEGWAVNKRADLMQIVPEINLKEIVEYGKKKGVGIILWAGYKAFDRDMERVCKHYAELGVKGFKVDFMNRNDAECVAFHYRAAATAAKYHLLLDFHGTYPPTGLNRTYPNVLNFEGVFGMEQNKWGPIAKNDQVTYAVTVPFARMFAGQMDYTQGAMINAQRSQYFANNSRPMSQGTRCEQLAEYIVFFSPLNMLCDSPVNYDANPRCTEFIAQVPVVWDETVPLRSSIGEYVAVARRSGQKWFVGALTNWSPRDLELDLSPLKVAGRKAKVYHDGVNADRYGEDWAVDEVVIPSDGKLSVHLAPGGGVAVEL